MRLMFLTWAIFLTFPSFAHADSSSIPTDPSGPELGVDPDMLYIDVQPRTYRRWSDRTPANNYILTLPISAPTNVGPAPTCDQMGAAADFCPAESVQPVFRGSGGIAVCFRAVYQMYVANGIFDPLPSKEFPTMSL